MCLIFVLNHFLGGHKPMLYIGFACAFDIQVDDLRAPQWKPLTAVIPSLPISWMVLLYPMKWDMSFLIPE